MKPDDSISRQANAHDQAHVTKPTMAIFILSPKLARRTQNDRGLGACSVLLCALRANHRRQCCDQNIQVEPKGTVLDIETVLLALRVEVAIAAR